MPPLPIDFMGTPKQLAISLRMRELPDQSGQMSQMTAPKLVSYVRDIFVSLRIRKTTFFTALIECVSQIGRRKTTRTRFYGICLLHTQRNTSVISRTKI